MNIARILPAITQKRKIFIFPDMDMLDKWKALAEGLKYPRIVWMGDYIKENASTDKDDVGDIVLRMWQEGGLTAKESKPIEPPPEPPEEPEWTAEDEAKERLMEVEVVEQALGYDKPNEALRLLMFKLDLRLTSEEITEPDYIGF